MGKHEINSHEDLAEYMTECTLATIEWMTLKSKRPVGEFKRQISIAQVGVDFLKRQDSVSHIRLRDVVDNHGGDVSAWADDLIQLFK